MNDGLVIDMFAGNSDNQHICGRWWCYCGTSDIINYEKYHKKQQLGATL